MLSHFRMNNTKVIIELKSSNGFERKLNVEELPFNNENTHQDLKISLAYSIKQSRNKKPKKNTYKPGGRCQLKSWKDGNYMQSGP